ncbi:MAG: molybdenum cofactor biosynthesis protein [Rhodobacteraceae bacterium]|nr:molybdenum cofactor biosynthesis protein [Paracoccaceae bacterium]
MNTDREFIPLGFGVLTVSDTRNFSSDKSGALLENNIVQAGHKLVKRTIVPDEKADIQRVLKGWINLETVDVILTTGGTGLTGRDVTVEAHSELYEKKINAFEVLFSFVSMKKIGMSAIQSRACAGVAAGTFLFALPGSPSACRDAWDQILRKQFDYRNMPCNFVEILPRLEENQKRKKG